ncbi:MAG: hypothetical protein ACE148_09805 [Vicinamibacterales bacterium]
MPERPSAAARFAAAEAAREALVSAALGRRPYLRFAFANPYNLSLFIGALGAAAITLNPVLALAALGAEAIWLLHAPGSKRLRHLLWDPRFEKLRLALEAEERAKKLKPLSDADRARVEDLVAQQQEIHRLASQNPSFTGDLLRSELVKTSRLVDAFIDMALTCARYEEYLESVDLGELESERARWEKQARAGAENDPQVDIARKNLAVILRRIEKLKEIRRYLGVARGQLDLIENSFRLIGDQIVTMQSPQQLAGQLDELLDGVESIREAAADTESFLTAIGIGASTK